MTVADLIRVLLELDQQCLTARPSSWGVAAELVHALAEHSEPSLRRPDLFGNWKSIDLSSVKRAALRRLNQPVLTAMHDTDNLRAALADMTAQRDALQAVVDDSGLQDAEHWRVHAESAEIECGQLRVQRDAALADVLALRIALEVIAERGCACGDPDEGMEVCDRHIAQNALNLVATMPADVTKDSP